MAALDWGTGGEHTPRRGRDRNRAGVTAGERGFRADAETQLGPLEDRDGRLCARFLGPP